MSKAELADVQDDDVNVKDREDVVDNDEEETEVDLEDILKGLKDDDEEAEEPREEPEEDSGEESEEEPEEPDDKTALTEEEFETRYQERHKVEVQNELNRIIPERVHRALKPTRELENITGMKLEQIKEIVVQNMVAATADDMGISEEEAKKIVEKDIKLRLHDASQEESNQQQQQITLEMKKFQYEQDKAKYLKQPKLARILKEFVSEIDDFARNGLVLDFESSMNQILGQKFTKGELIEKLQRGAEQKAIRTAEKKSKSVPQKKSQGGKSSGVVLNADQERMADFLGVSKKEYAQQLELDKPKRKSR